MYLNIESKAGTVMAGQVREYRKSPGSLNLAASAAAHYAKNLKERVVLVEGNSYMSRVYHIARETDDLRKYAIMSNVTAKVLIVEPNGDCYYATAQ
ncbi:hypothetical protein [Paenibacillus polymyxa]|uniref:hypothetical protein n=1 Tax=Paenibacillus polymyxa TaxID=1406 RepID=UPI002AB344B8|nr:hypothetical protein [Paenibacillus polymyxa]MDY8021214.1 hypothetical protein [Paenibacillus polymyxa]